MNTAKQTIKQKGRIKQFGTNWWSFGFEFLYSFSGFCFIDSYFSMCPDKTTLELVINHFHG